MENKYIKPYECGPLMTYNEFTAYQPKQSWELTPAEFKKQQEEEKEKEKWKITGSSMVVGSHNLGTETPISNPVTVSQSIEFPVS